MVERSELRLVDVARAGFQELSESRSRLVVLSGALGADLTDLLRSFRFAADPDAALSCIERLADRHAETLRGLTEDSRDRLCLLVGASPALGDFFVRWPAELRRILASDGAVIGKERAYAALRAAVRGMPDPALAPPNAAHVNDEVLAGEAGWIALRVRYRNLLAELMLHDLLSGLHGDPTAPFEEVAHSLSDLAGAAIEASLEVARASVRSGLTGPPIAAERLDLVRLGVVAMGKCGAEELNVVSDVDVMFIAESADDEALDTDRLIRIATRLASETMRGIHDPAAELPLWQLDANLRPEGRNGPLVRTLGSMFSYYERWAKGWEFQALLKARPLAGDLALSEAFVAGTRELVWASASREDFVGSVQRMRQRVTEHIADDDLDVQLKLGPGGLRDIEFSVQLLQLVHGQYDERLHPRGTLPALRALVDGGYIARSDGERLAADYRVLRVLEHRLQLRELRRTALMPRDDESLRVLARASHLVDSGPELRTMWEGVKQEVRELHLKIFYAPLLSAVAALPEEDLVLGSDEARARLVSIGFRDPDGAMRHLSALTRGTSRRARIQRNLMPVLLRWLAEGTDPDYGLLAFRRVSEANLESPWYLRLLRDGTDAAERLMRVLSCSRFAAELLESLPDAVAWLERDSSLQPSRLDALREEMRSLASRRDTLDAAAVALRAVHRREILRLAMSRVVDVIDDAAVSQGLDAAHTALLDALLMAVRQHDGGADGLEIALIGMGRYGGGELGFASDIDVIAVFRAAETFDANRASRQATRMIAEMRSLVSDPRFPVDLDFDLRPEGKNGPIVRSLASYRAYYERWSVTWEAQALLRARHVAGDTALGADFLLLADEIRYPVRFGSDQIREVRRMKARVETERLPQGADPRRHLKLGPGGVSDVEWLVQLIQLHEGHARPTLRTVSTVAALEAACAAELLTLQETSRLLESWRFASQVRSAIKLWTGRVSDSLPTDWQDLSGVVELLDLPSRRASDLEEHWFAVSRQARQVFEREFFGFAEDPRYPLA